MQIWQQPCVKLCQLALRPVQGLIYYTCTDSHREPSLIIRALLPCLSTLYHSSPLYSLLFVLYLSDPLWVIPHTSARGDVVPICHSLSYLLTSQEANDFPPLPRIKRMELFEAHEGDVVVWVVHDGQACSRDAGVQLRAGRIKSKRCSVQRCCITFAWGDFPSGLISTVGTVMFVWLTSSSLHYLLCETWFSGIATFIWGQSKDYQLTMNSFT